MSSVLGFRSVKFDRYDDGFVHSHSSLDITAMRSEVGFSMSVMSYKG